MTAEVHITSHVAEATGSRRCGGPNRLGPLRVGADLADVEPQPLQRRGEWLPRHRLQWAVADHEPFVPTEKSPESG